jgi:GntR family transcriptional regulator
MFNIDKLSGRPVYEQIIEQMQYLILVGGIVPDEQIPSVRSLSLDLSVNPNTIQKAYNELEFNKITYSVPGVGRFVAKDAKQKIGASYDKKVDVIYDASYWLALAGVEQTVITDTVSKAFTNAKRHMVERMKPNDKN